MKATGIVRKLDALGRVVLPKELRDKLDLQEDTPMEIFVNDNGDIVIRAYRPGCVLCGEQEVKGFLGGKAICHSCVEKAVRLIKP